jgi:hypothetical protein
MINTVEQNTISITTSLEFSMILGHTHTAALIDCPIPRTVEFLSDIVRLRRMPKQILQQV